MREEMEAASVCKETASALSKALKNLHDLEMSFVEGTKRQEGSKARPGVQLASFISIHSQSDPELKRWPAGAGAGAGRSSGGRCVGGGGRGRKRPCPAHRQVLPSNRYNRQCAACNRLRR